MALDPELLGKVFENLLAAFNPETRESARRQTGSYYTPRQVVDYMVAEALIAYWGDTITPHDGDKGWWRDRLGYLLDYADLFDDANDLIDDSEREALIWSIANIRVIDPAVGSGAFPMAILHRITLALSRLDPDNKAWRETQQRLATSRAGQAFGIEDKDERQGVLQEINEAFERYRSGFGRKLYLIQNSIYGVDIQPIACQIAKLRMFISLAIEQTPDSDPDNNYGIRPLPNLESKFVVADTLIGLKGQEGLASPRAVDLRRKWAANTEQHFHATTPQQKEALVRVDRRLRAELANELRNLGMPADHTDKIADWDRYNQNASADWFDPKYMFNTTQGFDIVIGNPPYIQLQRNQGALGKKYRPAGYNTFASTGDIYTLFYEKGCQLLKPNQGVLTYITSNSWMKAKYGEKLRKHLAGHHTPLALLEMGKDIFDAVVDTNILLLRQGGPSNPFPAVDQDTQSQTEEFPPPREQWGQVMPEGAAPWRILSQVEARILDKMRTKGTPLNQWGLRIYRGVTTGYNAAFIIDQATRDTLVAEDPRSAEILKPILRGRDLRPYQANWANLYLIATHNGYDGIPAVDINDYQAIKHHLNGFYHRLTKRYDKGRTPYNLRNCAYHAEFKEPKLFWTDLAPEGRFAYWDSEMYCINTAFFMTGPSLKYVQAVLNSTLMTWLMHKTALTTGMGAIRWIVFVVEGLPAPKATPAQQGPLVKIVNEILAAKSADPSADTSHLETEIDQMVYDLYGLTSEEVQTVEVRLPARQ